MKITVVSSPAAIAHALATARAIVPATPVSLSGGVQPGLLDAALIGRLEAAWETIERGLLQGYLMGRQAAESIIAKANEEVAELFASAGNRLRHAQSWLQEKLNGFVRTFIADTIGQVAAQHQVGGTDFKLTTLKSSQKLALSGNFKASLTEVFSAVCEGELVVEAEYTRATVQTPA